MLRSKRSGDSSTHGSAGRSSPLTENPKQTAANKHLIRAIEQLDLRGVQEVLRNADINHWVPKAAPTASPALALTLENGNVGKTPLMVAIETRDSIDSIAVHSPEQRGELKRNEKTAIKIISLLLEKGADMYATFTYGEHEIAAKDMGRMKWVELSLEAMPKEQKESIIARNDAKQARAKLSSDQQEALDGYLVEPVQAAVKLGSCSPTSLNMIEEMLQRGADPNVHIDDVDGRGFKISLTFICDSIPNLEALLMKYGGDPLA